MFDQLWAERITLGVNSVLQSKENTVQLSGLFLKKLWCCIGGEVKHDNLVLSAELIQISHRKEIQKMTFRGLWLRQSEGLVLLTEKDKREGTILL